MRIDAAGGNRYLAPVVLARIISKYGIAENDAVAKGGKFWSAHLVKKHDPLLFGLIVVREQGWRVRVCRCVRGKRSQGREKMFCTSEFSTFLTVGADGLQGGHAPSLICRMSVI